MTAEELWRMPGDGLRHELVEGELRRTAPAGYEYGKIAMRLSLPLARHVAENDLGDVCTAETGFLIKTNPDTVRAPDISFVSRESVDEVGDTRSYGRGAPDLAVEVISPSDKVDEVEEKVQEWPDAGWRLVLVVSPKLHTVTAYRSLTDIETLTANDSLDGGDVIPGFTYPLAALFVSKRSRRS